MLLVNVSILTAIPLLFYDIQHILVYILLSPFIFFFPKPLMTANTHHLNQLYYSHRENPDQVCFTPPTLAQLAINKYVLYIQ